jgi:hypothetical protein
MKHLERYALSVSHDIRDQVFPKQKDLVLGRYPIHTLFARLENCSLFLPFSTAVYLPVVDTCEHFAHCVGISRFPRAYNCRGQSYLSIHV